MENDLWMNFKQHASVCNLPNELYVVLICQTEPRYNTRRFLQDNRDSPSSLKFQDTVSALLLHVLPLWVCVVC